MASDLCCPAGNIPCHPTNSRGDAERMLRLHCEDLLLLARQVNGAAVLRPRLDCPDAMNSLVANE